MSEREIAVRRRLRDDFAHYAPRCMRIRTKSGKVEPLALNKAQAYIAGELDVAHGFYSEDEPGLVNGVLDAVAREVRPGELGERPGRASPTKASR